MNRKRFVLGLMMVGYFCFGHMLAHRVSWADFSVQPNITVEEEYTDNFYRAERRPTAVWITRVSPGFNMQGLTERSRLELNYHFNYYWYNDVNGAADTSELNYPGHDLDLYAATQLTSKLKLGLNENFILTREPAYSDMYSQIVSPDKYLRNRVTPALTYDIAEKGEVKLAYRNEYLSYLQPTVPSHEDSLENRGILTLTYHLNSTNHLDLENQYWRRDYEGDINSGYDSYQALLIFRREFSSYLEGHAGAGYHHRDFFQSQLSNINMFAYSIGLTGHTERSKLFVSFDHNLNDFTVSDQYFSAYLFKVMGEHLFLDRIRAYVGGFYQYSRYFDSPRRDDYWNATVGLGYLFFDKRLELSVEYDRNDRNSNQPGYSYVENQVYFRVAARHDFGK